ncbi:hypothetical protein MKX01_017316 [Papaver californicum]|nr:hypothetical protein MKX01_017316 [Papaver californicum]
MTYRKGFSAIGDSKLTSDVHWGCMHRSSQMLVAEALLFHHLGRSWRKPCEKVLDRGEKIEFLVDKTKNLRTQMMRKLVDDASKFLNDKVTKAVVTDPSYFNDF